MVDTITHKSSFHDKGKRPHDEDRVKLIVPFAKQNNLCLVVVVDGHGGSKCADFVIDRFPQLLETSIMNCKQEGITAYTTFMSHALSQCVEEWDIKCFGKEVHKIKNKETRKQFFDNRDEEKWSKEELESGCTLCTVLCDLVKRELYILNIGDSRAAWCCDEKLIGHTVDHSVKNKMEPIKDFSFEYGDGYLEDDLSMCRSIGDNTEKLFRIVSRKPDLLTIPMGITNTRLVVATDGFFDFVSCQDALYEEFKDADALAHQIQEFDDNITIVYMKFGPGLGNSKETVDFIPTCARGKKSRTKSPKKLDNVENMEEKSRKGRNGNGKTEIVIRTSRNAKQGKPIKKSIKRSPIVKMTKEQIEAILGDAPIEMKGNKKNNETKERHKKETGDSEKKERKKMGHKVNNELKGKSSDKSSDKSSGRKSNKLSDKKKSSGKKPVRSRKVADKSFDSLLKSLK